MTNSKRCLHALCEGFMPIDDWELVLRERFGLDDQDLAFMRELAELMNKYPDAPDRGIKMENPSVGSHPGGSA